jgi:hypothetical protein
MVAIVVVAPASLQASDCRVNSASHARRVNALRPRSKRPGKKTLPRSDDVVVASLPQSVPSMRKPSRAANPGHGQPLNPAVSPATNAVLTWHRESPVLRPHAILSDSSKKTASLDYHALLAARRA